jgi:ABC-2 type transport system ATP-binding protein
VIIINKGNIVADKPTSELQRMSSSTQIIEVEFDQKPNLTAIKNLKGVKRVDALKGNTFQVEASTKHDLRSDLFQFAVDNDLKVLGLSVEEQDLEDVFQRLTRN